MLSQDHVVQQTMISDVIAQTLLCDVAQQTMISDVIEDRQINTTRDAMRLEYDGNVVSIAEIQDLSIVNVILGETIASYDSQSTTYLEQDCFDISASSDVVLEEDR